MQTRPIPQPTDRSSRQVWLGLLTALLLALTVRLYGIGDQDYRFDELHSLSNSAGFRAEFESVPHGVILEDPPRHTDLTPESTTSFVWRRMVVDTHPPVYFTVLLGWRRLFGDTTFAVRMLPAILSALSILPVALILREYRRPVGAVCLAMALALSFSHIFMGQQNRPYSLGLLFVSISYWVLVRMEVRWIGLSRPEKLVHCGLYSAATFLAIMTHYFTGLALAGQAIFVLTRVRGALRRVWVVMVIVVVIAFALTWGRQLSIQMDLISSQPWLLEQHPDHLWRTLLRFMDLPVRLLMSHERYVLNYLLSGGGVLLLGAVLLTLVRSRCQEAVVFAGWYLVPVVTFTILDLTTEKQLLTHVRYPYVAMPGLVGLIVLASCNLRRSLRYGAVAFFLLLFAMTVKLPTQENPQNRRAAHLIAEQLGPGDLLIFDAMDWPDFSTLRIFQNISYYLPEFLEIPSPPCVLIRETPDEALRREIAKYDRIVVVAPRQDPIPNPVPGVYKLVDQTGYVELVGFIYLFERTPPGT